MLLTPEQIAFTTTHRTHHTSATAINQFGNQKKKNQADEIFDICLAAHRNGVVDLSRVEIRDQYERLYGRRMDDSRVSARVSELVCAKRLEVLPYTRNCKINSASVISVVRVPLALMAQEG